MRTTHDRRSGWRGRLPTRKNQMGWTSIDWSTGVWVKYDKRAGWIVIFGAKLSKEGYIVWNDIAD